MMKIKKDKLINKIIKLHPAEFPKKYSDRGWAKYTGGFVDDGYINIGRIKRASIEDLIECYKLYLIEKKKLKSSLEELSKLDYSGCNTLEDIINKQICYGIDKAIIETLEKDLVR